MLDHICYDKTTNCDYILINISNQSSLSCRLSPPQLPWDSVNSNYLFLRPLPLCIFSLIIQVRCPPAFASLPDAPPLVPFWVISWRLLITDASPPFQFTSQRGGQWLDGCCFSSGWGSSQTQWLLPSSLPGQCLLPFCHFPDPQPVWPKPGQDLNRPRISSLVCHKGSNLLPLAVTGKGSEGMGEDAFSRKVSHVHGTL